MNEQNTQQSLAFEYVLGTLRGKEREAFSEQLRTNEQLALEVRYWESALIEMSEDVAPLAPEKVTIKNIQAAIEERSSRSTSAKQNTFWEHLLPWKMATFSTCVLLLVVAVLFANNIMLTRDINATPNSDYVAVLVNEQNKPILTALTSSDGKKLWLKWESWKTPKGHSLQLWSQSRRDGQVRPLFVFEGEELQEITLDQATWRLIKDSSHLLITQEEPGGSPLDEPSELTLAKGVCIRLATTNT